MVAKNGGTTKIVSGETLFTREGYKFAYWKNAGGDIIAVNSDQGDSITLTANWYAVDKDGNISLSKIALNAPTFKFYQDNGQNENGRCRQARPP